MKVKAPDKLFQFWRNLDSPPPKKEKVDNIDQNERWSPKHEWSTRCHGKKFIRRLCRLKPGQGEAQIKGNVLKEETH